MLSKQIKPLSTWTKTKPNGLTQRYYNNELNQKPRFDWKTEAKSNLEVNTKHKNIHKK